MSYRILADALVLVHASFVLSVVLGGLLVLRWRRLAWLHLPVALWGFLVEATGWGCPLTRWENWLRVRAGQTGYEGGFIEHYLLPLIYPPGLTRGTQYLLAGLVVAVNLVIYALVLRKARSGRAGG